MAFVPGGEGSLQINPDGSYLAPMDFGNYGVGLFQTNGAPKPAVAFSFWSQLANREIIPIENYLKENSSSQDLNSIYTLGGIKKEQMDRTLLLLYRIQVQLSRKAEMNSCLSLILKSL